MNIFLYVHLLIDTDLKGNLKGAPKVLENVILG